MLLFKKQIYFQNVQRLKGIDDVRGDRGACPWSPSLCPPSPSGFLPITQSLERAGPQVRLDGVLQEKNISLKSPGLRI